MIRRALTAVSVAAFFWNAIPAVAPAQVLTIMPLGDSLTWGFDGVNGSPGYLAGLDTGGYRSPLYSLLTAQTGIGINYVGVSNENPSPTLTAAGQTAQDGFNGYRIDQITANLAGEEIPYTSIADYGGYWLTGGGGTGRGPETANVILLQIGANDIVQDYDPSFTGTPGTESASTFATDMTLRLETLINAIMYDEPGATLLIDGTTPITNPYLGDANSIVQDYDSDIAHLIATQYAGDKVDYVNMYKAFLDPGTSTVNSSLFGGDGLHLSTQGYAVMAQTWAGAIESDVTITPEPSTFALFGTGMLALLACGLLRGLFRASIHQ